MIPGLSVIIDAIKESRKIVQRMNSYAIYRIAETLRVLRVRHAGHPDLQLLPRHRRDDRDAGPAQRRLDPVHRLRQRALQAAARGLEHAPGARDGHRARASSAPSPPSACSTWATGCSTSTTPHLQTLMYLMLSVAGSLTIYLTRTRGPFWSIRPARILVVAVSSAEAVATLLAGFGILMPALGWDRVAVRVGLRPGLVPRDRPGETARLPDSRSGEHRGCGAHRHATGSPLNMPNQNALLGQGGPVPYRHDPEDPVYHDNRDCPYGQEIKRNGNDKTGTDGRRRCDWCTQHAECLVRPAFGDVTHARRRSLDPGLSALWRWAGRSAAWSIEGGRSCDR